MFSKLICWEQTSFVDVVSTKSVRKMADFETLTLCISINSQYVRYMFTICSPYVHYMFTIYSLYVHHIFTICSPYIHCIFTRRIWQMSFQPKSVGKMADFETLTLCISLNSLYVHYMFTICSLYVHHIFTNLPV